MPSLLELLEHDDDGMPLPEPPPQVLDAVKSEGGRRRTVRHRRTAALALAGLLLVGAPVVTLQVRDDGPDREVNVATDGGGSDPDVISDPLALPPLEPVPTTAVTAAPGTTAPATTVAPPTTAAARQGAGTTTTLPAGVPVGPQTTSTTQLVCRSSDNPACGDFRWEPAPAPNQALQVSFTSVPVNPKAGQAVTFAVTWSDDAPFWYDHFSIDGSQQHVACSPAPRYGPWMPPAQVPSGETKQYPATFPSAGEYTVRVTVRTGGCDSPYSDEKTVTVPVTVEPAP